MRVRKNFLTAFIFALFIQIAFVSAVGAITRIMPLGNSITQSIDSGETDEDRQVSYRKALWEKLLSAGYDVDFVGSRNSGFALFADGDHEGHPGWRDDEIVNGRLK